VLLFKVTFPTSENKRGHGRKRRPKGRGEEYLWGGIKARGWSQEGKEGNTREKKRKRQGMERGGKQTLSKGRGRKARGRRKKGEGDEGWMRGRKTEIGSQGR
jgi:hypothetical protein